MLDFFLSYILIYGQLMLFAVALLASFGFPFPITALAVASGALSAQGYFGLTQIIACCFVGCVIGDTTGYWIARKYGKSIFSRIGMHKVLISDRFTQTEASLEKHYRSMIFYSRFIVTFMGPPINIIAGL
ncbi:MAG: DedA family protein [Patescibacteria group bacterium]